MTFVSVTQSFNTTTSMGRLTLNILLSFAQFEREAIGERIRDKFAASRARGMWRGGHPPLGYDVRDRKLVVNEPEAAMVRMIFERFLRVGSATVLVRELAAEGVTTKRGKPVDKGFLYKLLGNRAYIGEAVHKGKAYPGEHTAIIGRDLWDKVHSIIQQSPRSRAGVGLESCGFWTEGRGGRTGRSTNTFFEGKPAVTILVHGAWDRGDLVVWGEASVDAALMVAGKRGCKPKVPAPLAYRRDPGADVLAEILSSAGMTPDGVAPEKVVLHLPTRGGMPLPSSPLIAEEDAEADGGNVSIAAHECSAITLGGRGAIDVLCRCMGDRVLRPGVFVADDLAFLAQSLRFCGAVVARQNVYPDVVEEGGNLVARWRPLSGPVEVAALGALTAAMPPACRAVSRRAGEDIAAPGIVLRSFVDGMVDALMRSAADDEAPPPPKAGSRRRSAVSDGSIDERWLAALRGVEPVILGTAAELADLRQRMRDWQRPLAAILSSPFRLCFRLEEPPAGEDETADRPSRKAVAIPEGTWRVGYFVQSAQDESLIVPTDQAWKAKGAAAKPFRHDGFDIKEFLLLSLGQASRLCPLIEGSLKGGVPAGYEMDASGAVEFLTAKAAALEQAGFGVMLPAWWSRKGTKLRLVNRARVKTSALQGGGGLSLDDIVRFDWTVALGEETLSQQDLMALARLKTPLVKVRGQWVLLDADEIRRAAALLKDGRGEMVARDVVRLALGGGGPADVAAIDAEGWIADLLSRLKDRACIEIPPMPEGFQGQLRPYQTRGFAWLEFLRRWGLGACLADDMGLGKTVQALALIQNDVRSGARDRCVLLVCPTSVVGNWQKEAARFTPDLAVMVHHGGQRAKGADFRKQALRHHLVVTSYALLQRDVEVLKAVPWSGVILDEAQNIKNGETKQAKAARALEAEYRVALTGTPVENSVGDLWSVMEFLNPGFLGSRASFKRDYFIPIQTRRDADAVERLKSLTGPFVLRRLKTDKSIIADLPEKMEMKVFCNLTKEQASLYAAVVQDAIDALEEADGIRRKGIVLATLSKLKQVCNHPAQFLGDNSTVHGRSGKLARLTEMLEEVLAVGERALVFTQFSEMGEIIRACLQDRFGREVPFLHGAVPKAKRDRMVERFQAGDGLPIFLLSLKAGGTGLTLTAANHVFHFDRWWNPAVENQATDRAFRIGQTRNVQVHKFLCAGTLEDRIDEMIERKKALAEAVVGTGEGWLTEFSTEQLRDLFALRQEAVGD